MAFRIAAGELKDRQGNVSNSPSRRTRCWYLRGRSCELWLGSHRGSEHRNLGHASSPRRTTCRSTGGSGREFAKHARVGEALGVAHVEVGPLVRTGCHAGKQLQRAMGATVARQPVASRVNGAPSKMIAGYRSIPQSKFWSRKVSWSPSSS